MKARKVRETPRDEAHVAAVTELGRKMLAVIAQDNNLVALDALASLSGMIIGMSGIPDIDDCLQMYAAMVRDVTSRVANDPERPHDLRFAPLRPGP